LAIFVVISNTNIRMNFLRNLLAAIIVAPHCFWNYVCNVPVLARPYRKVKEYSGSQNNSDLGIQLQTPSKRYVGMDESNPFAGLFKI